jgi:hypothetical protein
MATMMRTFAPSTTADASIGEATAGLLLGAADPLSAPATLDELLLIRLIGKLAGSPASADSPDGGELGQLLRRCRKLIGSSPRPALCVTQEAKALIDAARAILASAQPDPSVPLCLALAETTSDLLAQTAAAYRWSYRRYGSSGQLAELPAETVQALLDLSQRYVGASSARQ